MSPNGVITQSPTVFSGRFASGYPASSVDLGISSSLPPQSSTTSFMTSSPSSITDVTATNVGVRCPPHPLMLSTTNPTSVSHNTQFGMPLVNHNTSCLGLTLPTTHTTFGTPFLSTSGAYPGAAMNQTYSQASANFSVSRLPKLTLPTFGRDPLRWQSFLDLFAQPLIPILGLQVCKNSIT